MVGPKTNVTLNILQAGVRSHFLSIATVCKDRLLTQDDNRKIRELLRDLVDKTEYGIDQLAHYVNSIRNEPEDHK